MPLPSRGGSGSRLNRNNRTFRLRATDSRKARGYRSDPSGVPLAGCTRRLKSVRGGATSTPAASRILKVMKVTTAMSRLPAGPAADIAACRNG